MARKIRVKLILQLRASGMSRNGIVKSQHMSPTSVSDVFRRADANSLAWRDIAEKDEQEVYALLFPERHSEESAYTQPDWDYIHKELSKVGVTLKLLHHEYVERCQAENSLYFGYNKFCKEYSQYTIANDVTSRVGHKAGRIMEVDWSGPTMAVVDPTTGEIATIYLFVATLPFSRYTYVEPTLDMKEKTWLLCHVHAFEYFGGSTTCIVPDNLKTGVVKHPREGEVVLNDAYEQMAVHYCAAVIPARVRAPKDKPSVENTVGNIATDVIATLRNITFTSFSELKDAVSECLDAYNAKAFQKREGSRLRVFLEEEKPELKELPAVPYEICTWVMARKVQKNCHVCYKKNYYSVHHSLIGSEVDLRVTDTVLEVFSGYERVCTHPLFPGYVANHYSTHEADLPEGRSYADWDAQRYRNWASRIGSGCSECIDRIFISVPFEQQGYNSAHALLRLTHVYGAERLERACQMVLEQGVRIPRYKHVEPILKAGLDKADSVEQPTDSEDGGYVRGCDYYTRGRQ